MHLENENVYKSRFVPTDVFVDLPIIAYFYHISPKIKACHHEDRYSRVALGSHSLGSL